MQTIVVITTGGTIASTHDERGAAVASESGLALLGGLSAPEGTRVRLVEPMNVNSYAMSLADMDQVHREVGRALADGDTIAVVVTHGTDTLEETAALVALSHDDDRPVVFTGAQRPHDHPHRDGPRNLRDALVVAAAPEARGQGVLICFDGLVYAALGTHKVHTSALSAFADSDRGPLAEVVDGGLKTGGGPRSAARATDGALTMAGAGPRSCPVGRALAIGAVRVAVVPVYPGVDRTAFDAEVRAGARGVVLEATGRGNANPDIVAAVREHSANSGVRVLLSSRVPAGPVDGTYGGGGGGADLIAAGAVPAAGLRPGQARILLAVLLARGADVTAASVTATVHGAGGPPPLADAERPDAERPDAEGPDAEGPDRGSGPMRYAALPHELTTARKS